MLVSTQALETDQVLTVSGHICFLRPLPPSIDISNMTKNTRFAVSMAVKWECSKARFCMDFRWSRES